MPVRVVLVPDANESAAPVDALFPENLPPMMEALLLPVTSNPPPSPAAVQLATVLLTIVKAMQPLTNRPAPSEAARAPVIVLRAKAKGAQP